MNIIRKVATYLTPCFIAIVTYTACQSGTNTEPVHVAPARDTVANAPATTPVVIAGVDSLKKGVTDAIKDYPGVNATTNNGEITLTGDITRTNLQPLMSTLNSLHPKKINNNLTIK